MRSARSIPTCSRSPGRSNTKAWSNAVHERCRRSTIRFVDLVPRARHQAHAAPLRLSEDFRGLQQSLLVLHHPEIARRSRLAAGRRRAARGRAAGRGRRQGDHGHLAGHLGLWRRCQIRRRANWRGRDVSARISRSREGARRARRLGAAALRLPLPACRCGDPADGGGQESCPISIFRSSTPRLPC